MVGTVKEETHVSNELRLGEAVRGGHSVAGIRSAGDEPPGAVLDRTRVCCGWRGLSKLSGAEAQELREKSGLECDLHLEQKEH